ncbi:MAG: bifunctional DNA primase/polymerase, partial [Sphingomonadales bacterium]|nr:bifunctional DNA primase/polymerase [Sphingomonadales bacterium]
MGVYGEWQPIYAEAGLVSFPVDTEDKKPAIGNWQIAGPKASATWASRPGLANRLGLGLGCGKRNRLTVLDIDEPDEKPLARCLRSSSVQALLLSALHLASFMA